MTDLRFTSTEIQLIASLLNHDAVSIIWDINAFYFNTADTTYKMECLEAQPEGSDYEFDEVFFCRFEKLAECGRFDDSEQGYWFKTVVANAKIRSIEVIETAHVFPDNTLSSIQVHGNGITHVSLGLVINTDAGIVPAWLLPSRHGFTWLEKQRVYTSDEVDKWLRYDIKVYNRNLLPRNS